MHWVFIAANNLSLVAESGGRLFVVVFGLLVPVASLALEHWLQAHGFSSCSTQAQQLCFLGPRAQAQKLWHTGLAAPRHVESSQTRD